MRHLWAGLAENPALPAGAVERLLALDEPDLSRELAERSDLTERQAAFLAERGADVAARLAEQGRLSADRVDPTRQPRAALALLRAGQAPPGWAELLVERPDLREELASCPELPAEVARRLAVDPDLDVQIELAESVTDPAALALLGGHPSQHVREAVGWNPSAPPGVLADLLNDRPPLAGCVVRERHPVPWTHPPDCPDPDCTLPGGAACDGSHQYARRAVVRAALANPATPAAEAVRYLADPSGLLRACLAERTDLDPSAYTALAADQELWVLAALAENPAIGEELIRQLAAHPHEHVRRAAAHNPRVPLDALERLCADVHLGPVLLPRIAAAGPGECERLAAAAQPELRRLLALRRDLPGPVRDRLADDPVAKVGNAVAAHPGLDEGRLRTLHERHGRAVAPGIAANPDAPSALLRALVTADHNVATLRAVAVHPAADAATLVACLRDRRARRRAAAHPALPPDRLRELLADPDPVTAQHAAANPSLRVADLLRLMPQTR